MDLHLPSYHWEHRLPNWPAAVVAGLVAGALLMLLDLLWSAFVVGESPWRTSHLIAAMVLGPDALASAAFGVGVVSAALVTHYVLGVVFALALAFVVAGFHWDGDPTVMAIAGALFGVVLYGLDFHVMTQLFPWFAELRGWPTFIAHLLFGVVAALLYWKLNPQADSGLRRRAG